MANPSLPDRQSPAFNFYPRQFLIATATTSLEERGALFTSVCEAVASRNEAFFATQKPAFVGRIYWRRAKRPHIPTSIRRAVFHRDWSACVECGATRRLELDHVIPFSQGGQDTIENLRVLCKPCNIKRGAPEER